jgi:carbamate kinase
MTKPTLVVAIGGNALLTRGEPLEACIQRKNIEVAAKTIAKLVVQWRVVLVHGNGPQIGLLALQNSAYQNVAPYPLDILGAESQGMIGYMLLESLKRLLPQQEISVLLTQVEVSHSDPAFYHPTKYIGPVYEQTQAESLIVEKGWTFNADGRWFRRVVPSPQPLHIVEIDAIKTLIERNHLVICNGGGGVPIIEKADGYHGVEAVIDKDLSAALLAQQINADALLILTDADAVYLNWGTPAQHPLAKTTPEQLRNMHFDDGSMAPKVTACCRFVEHCHGIAGIGALADGAAILAGDRGTLICN